MTVSTLIAAAVLAVTPITPTHREGNISHMGDTPVPARYLALPCRTAANVPCGITVELCGPAACEVLRQTDYGPSQRVHPDRIADVAPAMFEHLCGVPAGRGVCEGRWTAVDAPGRPRTTLPPTDTAPRPARPLRGHPVR